MPSAAVSTFCLSVYLILKTSPKGIRTLNTPILEWRRLRHRDKQLIGPRSCGWKVVSQASTLTVMLYCLVIYSGPGSSGNFRCVERAKESTPEAPEGLKGNAPAHVSVRW